jgi:hypothetical protein
MEAQNPLPGRPDVTVRLEWMGAAARDPEGRNLLPGKANYLLGPPEKWITDVPMYGRVQYRQLYPSVDAVFYGSNGRLEHDFVLAPGADPSRLRFRLRGERITLGEDGDISVQVNGSAMTLHKPIAYQEKNGVRQLVKVNYVRHSGDVFAFRVGNYDRTRELVIDPVVTFSTFVSPGAVSGHSALVSGLAGDAAGNSYVLINFGLSNKIYKIDASGSTVVFQSTVPMAQVMAIDPAGNSYFAGSTDPSFTPTPGAFQTTNVGRRATVFKLNAAGNQITNATYLGGSTLEVLQPGGISADATGNVYVTGTTESNDFPLLHAFQTTFGGGLIDVFVTKLKPDLSGLLVSTYLGGNGEDFSNGIANDGSGNIYVAGNTGSSNFPIANAIIPTSSSSSNLYVTKIASDGTLAYSTYFGSSGFFGISAISAMDDGTLFLAGGTASTDFPLLHSLQSLDSAQDYPFISKLTPAGQLAYSTLLPVQPNGLGLATGLAVDASGQAYAVGLYGNHLSAGFTPDLPPVNAVQALPNSLPQLSACSPVDDTFVVVLDSTPSFVFASYLAASMYFTEAETIGEFPRIALAGNNGLRIATEAPPTFPLVKPVQPVFNGGCDSIRESFAYHPALAAIDLSTSAPVMGIGPMQLSFSSQSVGTNSAAQTINLQNLGSAPLTINSIVTSGDFAETNTCNGSIAAGSMCSASVTFKPTAGGTRNGTLTITDNASGSPQVVQLTGAGAAPAVTLSASSLDFGSQPPNTTSAPKTITLTNSGTATLNISRVGTSGDFAETNTCGTTVAAGANCTISVTFTPTAGGSRTGQLTITDDAAGSPQTVALTGSGGDFSIPAPNSTTATVSAGQTATYNLSVLAAAGFSGAVNLNCTGAPATVTCSVPSSINATAGASTPFTVTVTNDRTCLSLLKVTLALHSLAGVRPAHRRIAAGRTQINKTSGHASACLGVVERSGVLQWRFVLSSSKWRHASRYIYTDGHWHRKFVKQQHETHSECDVGLARRGPPRQVLREEVSVRGKMARPRA